MTMQSATGNLRDEHVRILEVVGVLDRLVDPAASTLDLRAIEGCIEFFRLFTDACHHGKEEDVLFPELAARGMPEDQGPIAVMLYEHEVGRDGAFKKAEELTAETFYKAAASHRDQLLEVASAFPIRIERHSKYIRDQRKRLE